MTGSITECDGRPVSVHLTLDIHPVAKGRPRFSSMGQVYTPKKTRDFEKQVRLLALCHWRNREPLAGPLKVVIMFYLKPPKKKVRELPTCKPDLDNFKKAVLDSLNGLIWKDDAQIVESTQEKKYDWEKRRGYIEISIQEVSLDASRSH